MKLFITTKAQKELDKTPDPLAKTIVRHLRTLADNPYPVNSKKLQGQDNHRLRIGSYRVIYTIDIKHKEITVLRVTDRKTVFK